MKRPSRLGHDKERHMIKNILLLGLLTWVSLSFAKHPHHEAVAREKLSEADSFKVEKALPEQEAKRGVAGARIKKQKASTKSEEKSQDVPTESDSEVRYWQYSE